MRMAEPGLQNGSPGSKVPARPLGIGRGSRPSPSLAKPTAASTLQGLQRNVAYELHENHEFLRDVTKKFLSEKRIPYLEDVSSEFTKLTGSPLLEVALALGYSTESEIFKAIDLDLPLRNEGHRQGYYDFSDYAAQKARAKMPLGCHPEVSKPPS
ncbi:uncharacterized protein LOC100908343 [Galendromus occidentalis]|uniref:Uncharacterized protein LOC100908343 n=1 Tax=Galendromus occidentalis TaxID=34638 RepID=A0AAJ6QNB3_9ACAR|nr:uncharacterized protein LOC100908343 [Galendromus occidentalis]